MKGTEDERILRFQQLFDQLTVGIIFLDQQGYCIDANLAAAQFTEYSQIELSQLPLTDLIYSKDESDKFRDWLLQGETATYYFESAWVTKSNKLIIVKSGSRELGNLEFI